MAVVVDERRLPQQVVECLELLPEVVERFGVLNAIGDIEGVDDVLHAPHAVHRLGLDEFLVVASGIGDHDGSSASFASSLDSSSMWASSAASASVSTTK